MEGEKVSESKAEQIIDSFFVIDRKLKKSSLLQGMFFTSNRLIIAYLNNQLSKPTIISTLFRYWEPYNHRYNVKKFEEIRTLSPDFILRENENNFSIPYSDIVQVDIGREVSAILLKILTSNQKYFFTLSSSKEFESKAEDAERLTNILKLVIPGKLVIE